MCLVSRVAPPKCWWNYQTTSDHRNEFETQEMEISHCSCSGQGGSQGFLVILNSQARARSKRSRQPVSWLHTLSITFSFDQVGIYFPICRLVLQAMCRLQHRDRKNKIFYSGRVSNKAHISEGGWGHSDPGTRLLKYCKSGADNSAKTTQSPCLSAQLFVANIYWNICEVPKARIRVSADKSGVRSDL